MIRAVIRWLLGLARCPYRMPDCKGRECWRCQQDRAK